MYCYCVQGNVLLLCTGKRTVTVYSEMYCYCVQGHVRWELNWKIESSKLGLRLREPPLTPTQLYTSHSLRHTLKSLLPRISKLLSAAINATIPTEHCYNCLPVSSPVLKWLQAVYKLAVSVGREMPQVSWNPKFHHSVHKSPISWARLIQSTSPFYFFKIHFIIIPSSKAWVSQIISYLR